jgi:hypothetical protein
MTQAALARPRRRECAFLTWNRRRWRDEVPVAAVPDRVALGNAFADATSDGPSWTLCVSCRGGSGRSSCCGS